MFTFFYTNSCLNIWLFSKFISNQFLFQNKKRTQVDFDRVDFNSGWYLISIAVDFDRVDFERGWILIAGWFWTCPIRNHYSSATALKQQLTIWTEPHFTELKMNRKWTLLSEVGIFIYCFCVFRVFNTLFITMCAAIVTVVKFRYIK